MLAVFIPLNPMFPRPGLDPSYHFAINQAVAQRLVFGKDIIFTMGPYGSINTRLYHPATDSLMVWGGLFLGVCYSLLLLLLAREVRFQWLLVYVAFVTGIMYWGSARFFSYPLILVLVSYRISLTSTHAGSLDLSKPSTIGFAICFAPLGLLPLIKVSLLLLCGPTAVACFFLLWRSKQKPLAYSSIIIPSISTVLFWTVSGQPILALPNFLVNIPTIVSGYTEAMAMTGNAMEIVIYIIASVAILYAIATDNLGPPIHSSILFLCYALFLFIAFKEGFVRHDDHALTAGASIVVAALSVKFILKERRLITALLPAVLAWGYIDKNYVNSSTGSIYSSIRHTYSNAWNGLYVRLAGTNALQKSFDDHIDVIKNKFHIPKLHGTADIYSYHQSSLLASGNTWSPRPMPQSLTAYNPTLAKLNEAHLQSENRPDNILFRVEPTDGRFPSLEDGLSWPTLFNDYYVTKLENDVLYLKRRASSSKQGLMTEFYTATHKLGEEIALPTTREPLFAEIEIFPTFLGTLASIFFKPPQLNISVTLSDGTKRDYRFIAGMARSGFLISPLVANTKDIVFLTGPDTGYLESNIMKTVEIFQSGGKAIFWNSSYSMKLSKINLARDTNVANIIIFDRIIDLNGITETSSASCDGSIDSVKTISNILSVNGWTAIAAIDGIVPDTVFLTLTNESGKKIYVKARSTPRVDVKEAFMQPKMPDTGFSADIDVSVLSGKYVLGVSRVYKGNLESCPQFNHGKARIDVEIGRQPLPALSR
jgi:hypothetical protein